MKILFKDVTAQEMVNRGQKQAFIINLKPLSLVFVAIAAFVLVITATGLSLMNKNDMKSFITDMEP